MFLQILFLEILQRQSLLEVKSAVTGAVNYSRCICYGLLVQLHAFDKSSYQWPTGL